MYYLFRLLYFLADKELLSKIAPLLYYMDFKRKKIVFKNLDIAFPNKSKREKEVIAKNTYKNFAIFFEDIVKINKKIELVDNIEVINEEYFLEIKDLNRPIIIMSAHFGNWELSGKFLYRRYKRNIAAVMREIENKKINDFFKKIRGYQDKIKLINRKSSAREIIKAVKKEKRIVGILIDQYSRSKNAVKVNFFKETTFNPAITKLAKSLNAIVIPLFFFKHNGKYYAKFYESKEFTENDTIYSFTQWQADIIMDIIREYPDQYYWFHNRWKK